jgi:rhodanese-related sulfurtransferase
MLNSAVPAITAAELKQRLHNGDDIVLIDVREPYEHAAFNIGGLLIPLGELMEHADEIPSDKPVVLYCRKGIRSHIAIQRLQQKYQQLNLINLQGGMDAWQQAER